MLQPVHVCDLLVDPATHPRRQAHLSAASGLAQVGQWFYVVADDEHHLGMFELGAGQATPLRLHRIVAGDLPGDKGKRKKHKPDLEVLAVLPPMDGHQHGLLLALGSGSRPNREQAFLLDLNNDGTLADDARIIDLTGLYCTLRLTFPDLNIEGAFIADGRFHLLQRGNKGDTRNACIEYSLTQVQDWLAGRCSTPPDAIRFVQFALGELGGVPLGFTDGAALPGGGWIFSAVAEDTSDSYRDGSCAGSAIGWVAANGELQRLEPIASAPKVEGITLAGGNQLLMVTDSDDPAIASRLFSLSLG